MSFRKKLYVSGLAASTTTVSLRQSFQAYGELTECKLVFDPLLRTPRGYGYVTFRNQPDAEQAILGMNQQELDGSTITVEIARDPHFRTSSSSSSSSAAAATAMTMTALPPQAAVTYKEDPFDNANRMTFATLCDRLDCIQLSKASQAHKLSLLFDEDLVKYLKHQSWYPIMRLVMPELDRERPKYNLKAAALSKLLVKAMQGQRNSEFADRLMNWKDPGKANGGSVGDFCSVLRDVLIGRHYPTSYSSSTTAAKKLTLEEINTLLDQLYEAAATEERQQVINTVVSRCTVTEICWFVRIVLKDMHLGGLHQASLLKRYHADAVAAMENHGDLRRCLAELNDPQRRHKFTIELFAVISPMLARVVRMDRATELLGDFLIEPKFDGDRMLVHVDKTAQAAGALPVRLYTRNGTDYTARYGSPQLFAQFLQAVPGCVRCILDGEMLAWDCDAGGGAGGVMDFGNTTSVALEMNHAEYNGRRWLYYKCFDALLIEDGKGGGAVLTEEPLKVRRARLKSVFSPVDRRVELVEPLAVVTSPDLEVRHRTVMTELDKIMLAKGEGLILKSLSTPYVGGETGRTQGHWVKVKPEHVNGLQEEVDMVILGGYYPDSKRRVNQQGDPSVFLVGVPAPTQPGRFLCVAKVGTGYSLRELEELRSRLRPHLVRTSAQRMPPHYGLPMKAADCPDVWLPVQHSVVLQVTGSELVPSEAFEAGYTLRFPRVSRIRYDKTYAECTTMADLKRFAVDFAGGGDAGGLHGAKRAGDISRLDARRNGGPAPAGSSAFASSGARNTSPAKKKRQYTEILGLGSTDHLVGLRSTSSKALAGEHTFYVFPGTAAAACGLCNKQEIEAFISSHGGNVVQVPSGKRAVYLIASPTTVPSQQLRNIQSQGKLDMMRVEFVLDWERQHQQQEEEDSSPPDALFEHYVWMSDATRTRLHERGLLDEFGDHYEQDADMQSLQRCMKAAATTATVVDAAETKKKKKKVKIDDDMMTLLRDSDDPLASPLNVFRGVFATFVGAGGELEAIMVRLRGGVVLPELSDRVTHVFFPDDAAAAGVVVEQTKAAWRALSSSSSSSRREPAWLKSSLVTAVCSGADDGPPLPWEHHPTAEFEL